MYRITCDFCSDGDFIIYYRPGETITGSMCEWMIPGTWLED